MDRLKQAIRLIVPWLLPIFLIIWWYLATVNTTTASIMPAPGKVWDRAVKMLKTGQLQEYTAVSTQRALLGLLIGGVIGLVLAILTGISKTIDLVLNTSIQMLRTVPVLGAISLMIIWFGIGEEVKIYMVAFGVFFPIYINTYHGIKSVDKGLIEMGKVYGLNRFKLFINIILPSSLSSILVGLRLSLGTMWLILIAAETIATDAGIGYMAMSARELMQMDKVVLCLLIYALLGKLSDVIARALEFVLLRWQRA